MKKFGLFALLLSLGLTMGCEPAKPKPAAAPDTPAGAPASGESAAPSEPAGTDASGTGDDAAADEPAAGGSTEK